MSVISCRFLPSANLGITLMELKLHHFAKGDVWTLTVSCNCSICIYGPKINYSSGFIIHAYQEYFLFLVVSLPFYNFITSDFVVPLFQKMLFTMYLKSSFRSVVSFLAYSCFLTYFLSSMPRRKAIDEGSSYQLYCVYPVGRISTNFM